MKIVLLSLLMLTVAHVHSQNVELTVEPNHSTVGFSIDIAGFTKVTGKFSDYTIDLVWDSSAHRAISITSSIAVKSINTGIPDRDEHLLSSDFFDEQNFPLISFESDKVRTIDESHFVAEGQFTMHGVSQPFELPFEVVKVEGNTVGIRSTSVLKRSTYGVGSDFSHDSMPEFLSDEIEVHIFFWTKKAKKD